MPSAPHQACVFQRTAVSSRRQRTWACAVGRTDHVSPLEALVLTKAVRWVGDDELIDCLAYSGFYIRAEDLLTQTVDEGECYAATGSPGPYLPHEPCNCGVPFARHESGDHGVIEVSLCTCGRDLPWLVDMSGVTGELFVISPGEKVFTPSISLEALSLPSVQL